MSWLVNVMLLQSLFPPALIWTFRDDFFHSHWLLSFAVSIFWSLPSVRSSWTVIISAVDNMNHFIVQNLGLWSQWSARHRVYDRGRWRSVAETATLLQGHATWWWWWWWWYTCPSYCYIVWLLYFLHFVKFSLNENGIVWYGMIGYWRHHVVRLSVCNAVHCGSQSQGGCTGLKVAPVCS